MIDTAYPYSVTFIDFKLLSGSANSEYYSFVNAEQHRLLGIHSVPTIPEEYAGWWTPSGPDLDRICVLTHFTEYSSPLWHTCATNKIKAEHFQATGSGPSHPPNHWYYFGEHYIYTWLTEWPPPRTTNTLPSPHLCMQYHQILKVF